MFYLDDDESDTGSSSESTHPGEEHKQEDLDAEDGSDASQIL